MGWFSTIMKFKSKFPEIRLAWYMSSTCFLENEPIKWNENLKWLSIQWQKIVCIFHNCAFTNVTSYYASNFLFSLYYRWKKLYSTVLKHKQHFILLSKMTQKNCRIVFQCFYCLKCFLCHTWLSFYVMQTRAEIKDLTASSW